MDGTIYLPEGTELFSREGLKQYFCVFKMSVNQAKGCGSDHV